MVVLVVDGDPGNADLLAEICRVAGYEVLAADSGPHGLVLAKEHCPDLILLDVTMPAMDGYEVLAKIKVDARLSEIPVILASASAEAEDKMKALGAGASEFVRKPFRPNELQQRMRHLLELHAAKRKLREAEIAFGALRATDPVTGAGNFQRLHSVLEYEYGRACRYLRPLSVACLADESIDALLSEAGRSLADAKLQHIAKMIGDRVREVDRIFRIDNAEFVMVFPETPEAGARIALERIASCILATAKSADHQPRLFCSIASLPNAHIRRPEDLFRAVNVALADARKLGSDAAIVDFKEFT